MTIKHLLSIWVIVGVMASATVAVGANFSWFSGGLTMAVILIFGLALRAISGLRRGK